jgi:hypothetical protein
MNSSIQHQFSFTYLKKWLFVLLVIQILLAVGIYAYHQHRQPQVEAKALLTFNRADVDRLVIRDSSSTVTLKKSGSDWLLPDLQQLPVDAQKLEDLLTKLQGTKLTWPVATSASSHERFEVAESKFQRRVEFYQNDKKLGELFLGSSPGFKKIHLRTADEDAVYTVELATFEFATSNKDWLKKDLLAVVNPQSIKGADYELQQQDNNWSLAGDLNNKVNNAKVSELTNALANIQILDVATTKPEGEVTSLGVKVDGEEWLYELVKSGDLYYIKRQDRDLYFTLSQYEYERVAKVVKTDLISVENAADTSDASSSAGFSVVPSK